MPLYPTWQDIALRLVLTLIAGAAIGFDRGVRSHAAGIRTTILVALAASVAMIQANILLPVDGKTPASFGVMDLMRLPLGILTGVGFIGGGAILRRGDLIIGVTTAATLWVTTVIGLCLGGGQLGLGVVATILAVATLAALKWIDKRIPREQRAMLVIEANPAWAADDRLGQLLGPLGYRAKFFEQSRSGEAQTMKFVISWKRPEASGPPTDLLSSLDKSFKVVSLALVAEPNE